MPRRRTKFSRQYECLDCRLDTRAQDEYYMLNHPIWAQVNPAILGMLCIGCVEKRLGRRLRASDFMDCPTNIGEYFGKSARLLHRLSRYKRREKPDPFQAHAEIEDVRLPDG